MCVKGVATRFDLAYWIVEEQWNTAIAQSTNWQPRLATMLMTISRLPPTVERPRRVNNVCGGSERYTAMQCRGNI